MLSVPAVAYLDCSVPFFIIGWNCCWNLFCSLVGEYFAASWHIWEELLVLILILAHYLCRIHCIDVCQYPVLILVLFLSSSSSPNLGWLHSNWILRCQPSDHPEVLRQPPIEVMIHIILSWLSYLECWPLHILVDLMWLYIPFNDYIW